MTVGGVASRLMVMSGALARGLRYWCTNRETSSQLCRLSAPELPCRSVGLS